MNVRHPSSCLQPVFSQVEHHPKAWGDEYWIANNEKYCGKILKFKKGSNFSMHFHIKKQESWYVMEGELNLEYFDLQTATRHSKVLSEGDCVHLKPNIPHKLTALKDSSVFEVSTQHFEDDSYRTEKSNKDS
tara:strand:+ start:589 stop:984 length:396 start_codon:yes stop_codon:yes gene_type:complete